VPYLALLYLGIVQLGLIGAALAWSIRCTVDAILLIALDRIEPSTLRRLALYGAIVLAAVAVMALTATPAYRWLLLSSLAALTAAVLARTIPARLQSLVRQYSFGRQAKNGARP
jgi:hypothetical protein